MGVQADHRPGTELLAGRTVAYVLSGYPVLSQTFVRDEVATMRAAGSGRGRHGRRGRRR